MPIFDHHFDAKDAFNDTMEDDTLTKVPSIDYYAVLALPRDATTAEIRNRFLMLSREFHPDRLRHRLQRTDITPERLDALEDFATFTFPTIDRAYKILCDPTKRFAYDMYGEEGVLALEKDTCNDLKSREALSTYLKSKEKLDQYIQEIIQAMKQAKLQASFVSLSDVVMHVDASDFYNHRIQSIRKFGQSEYQPITRTEMTMRQQFVIPISNSTRWTLGAYLMDRENLAMGGFTSQIAYTGSDVSLPSVNLSTQMGWKPKCALQCSQSISLYSSGTLSWEYDETGIQIGGSVLHALTSQTHGQMMWGTREGLTLGIANDATNHKTSFRIGVGSRVPMLMNVQDENGVVRSVSVLRKMPVPQISCAAKYYISPKTNIRGSFSSDLLLRQVSVSLGSAFNVARKAKIAIDVLLAYTGVTFQFGCKRGNVRFVIPIFLAPFSTTTAFGAFIAATSPHFVSAVVTQILKPNLQHRQRVARKQFEEDRNRQIEIRKDVANKQQILMQRTASEKRQQEVARSKKAREASKPTPMNSGLVILLARYGCSMEENGLKLHENDSIMENECLSSSDQESVINDEVLYQANEMLERKTGSQWTNVTIPIQFFVQNGRLELPAQSKSHLLGFYNPCDTGKRDAFTPSPQL
uniref:Uncharacterized protein AlNc14C140G7224 n=1 Tax=Albugo laibachii Nc14 TaxID=890382 RepID=F0WL37_9STRA|nr:conserved hypothetical protein [Albugo laibachii Nc14]|eukprot:CCA21997.1 conserved hypothetical protein [Albugo laibachii Nc14]